MKAFLVLALLLTSCATVNQPMNPSVFYRREMKIKVNDYEGTGTLVVPKADKYFMSIEANGDLDLFTLTTCHREEAIENASNSGMLRSDRKRSFTFRPVSGVETKGPCPMQMAGYEQDKARHSWGLVDFESEESTLPAIVRCNGKEYQSRGVTVCQSRQGLIQQIQFPVPVLTSQKASCPPPKSTDGKLFQFEMPGKECFFVFMEAGTSSRIHRLTTVGYESILIKGP